MCTQNSKSIFVNDFFIMLLIAKKEKNCKVDFRDFLNEEKYFSIYLIFYLG